MDLHPGEQIVFEGHPSWRAVLLFYLAGVALVAVVAVDRRARFGDRGRDPRRRRRG